MPTVQDAAVRLSRTPAGLEGLPRPGRCLVMGVLNVLAAVAGRHCAT
ncbi:hypothetical protein [Streptomyces sp. NPDC002156]